MSRLGEFDLGGVAAVYIEIAPSNWAVVDDGRSRGDDKVRVLFARILNFP